MRAWRNANLARTQAHERVYATFTPLYKALAGALA